MSGWLMRDTITSILFKSNQMFQEMINPIDSLLQGFSSSTKTTDAKSKKVPRTSMNNFKSFKIVQWRRIFHSVSLSYTKVKIYTWTYTDTEYPSLDFIHTT